MTKINPEILNNSIAASITAITAATAVKWGGHFVVILSTTSLFYTVVTAVACYVVAKTVQELFNEYAFKGKFEGTALGVLVQGGLFVAGTYFGLISSEQISPIASVIAAIVLMMNNFWNVSTHINSKIEEEKKVTESTTETSGTISIDVEDDIKIDENELKLKEEKIEELNEKIIDLNNQIAQLKLNPENDKKRFNELENENNEIKKENEKLRNQVSDLDIQLIHVLEEVKGNIGELKLQFLEKEEEEERLTSEVQLLQQENESLGNQVKMLEEARVNNFEKTNKYGQQLKIELQDVIKQNKELSLNLKKAKEELKEIKKLAIKPN